LSGKNRIQIRIGMDDTDHVEMGCTTFEFNNLMSILTKKIISFEEKERRLVRLWPFASRRTRGNAALSSLVSIDSNELDEISSLIDQWIIELSGRIKKHPKNGVQASPSVVLAIEKLPQSMYWEAVTEQVDLKKRLSEIGDIILFGEESAWGVIGSTSAIAWEAKTDSTWELIAWRQDILFGSERKISNQSIIDMEEKVPGTFANRDPTKGRSLIAPRTPCPVLYGIRGSTKEQVLLAHNFLQKRIDVEKCSSFAIHRTNQLSDDHILGYHRATILSKPIEMTGGHAKISCLSSGKREDLVAFKESGPVNQMLRKLNVGDIIDFVGLKNIDNSYHLERIRVINNSPRLKSRPLCCGKATKSIGSNQNLRCNSCGKVIEKNWLTKQIDFELNTWAEPTASNRRHLSMPLSIGNPRSAKIKTRTSTD
tara:strand:- start:146995 stop:148269 length:1275 start_codon:yes stop_codon:yes gene_type:complete